MREKGIEDAVQAVTSANNELGYRAFSLDIYGQVDQAQAEWFAHLRQTFPDNIRYAGIVPFDKSVDILKHYFALLFPTYYQGEGFAGTLIDAYAAGVPVIASDWKYNAELVSKAVGVVYPTEDQIALVEILKAVAVNPTILLNKKQTCLRETKIYRPEQAIRELLKQIEGN